MTKEEFNKLWTLSYPDAVPISYLFKHDYSDRWFRIHSLPESKRYADNDTEWKILLSRQNEVITDLFGDNAEVLLITGEYNYGEETTFITDQEVVYKPYNFTRLDNIDLHKVEPREYEEGVIYRPAFAKIIWNTNQHDRLLKEIANDNTRAFFLSFKKDIIIAPYDGGVDFILADSETKDIYKNKYTHWLSGREDGL